MTMGMGTGNWAELTGTVDYATGAFTLKVTDDYTYNTSKMKRRGGLGGCDVVTTAHPATENFDGDQLIARAQSNSLSHVPYTETVTAPDMTVDLLPLGGRFHSAGQYRISMGRGHLL